ncbi:MAG TPA: hypothetical protein VNZ03_23965 [Terriglobales bacterium]|nr:hypothetical protein [Terriglobales bacterium]
MRIERPGIRVWTSVLPLLWFSATLLLGASRTVGDDSAKLEGRFDGPAELPRVHVSSALADTPARGEIREVHAGDDLQKAIDGSKCGDTLALQAGATFRGVFRLPNKPCDDARWIIVRTNTSDSNLPSEGTRITPCYAGVTSLPGRPDFHCSSAKNVMAKVEFDGPGESGPILFLSGANHYRMIGLEVTRAKPQLHMRDLITPDQPRSTAHHLVFDRLWIHGTAQDETKGGVHLNGVTYAAIVNSYFSDFHCIARAGSCTDAQAVNGGGGDEPGGPYKIFDNFLEASGENILFGGAPGSTTPADIEIRRNHFFKPLLWKPGQPGFVGSYTGDPYIVKNHFELKNAQRVLLEGNLLENCWGGFSQMGFSIVLTPANQGGKCPKCQVSDVTIRYNKVSHVGNGIAIGTGVGKLMAASAGGERYSIHDVVFDDIDATAYKGFGAFTFLLSVNPPINSVKIDHVTAFPSGPLLSILNLKDKLKNLTVTNNLLISGKRQIVGAGGGPTNCVHLGDDPAAALSNCIANPLVTLNLIIGGRGNWPPGNIVVNDVAAAGIQDFHDGRGGDYRLCRQAGNGCKKTSPGAKAASDGKDIGADIDAVEAAVSGVE